MASTSRAMCWALRDFVPFEDHVLDEVGDPIDLGKLMARAGAHPDAHGYGADVLHLFGKNSQAVWQDGTANIAFVTHNEIQNPSGV